MPDGCIDTRSPRLRFPRHDRPLRSILLRLVRHKGTVCAHTSWSFDSPFSLPSFLITSPIPTAIRFLAEPCAVSRLELVETHSLQAAGSRCCVIPTDAFRSPNPPRRSHRLCHGLALSSKLNQVPSAGRRIARRYSDGLMCRLFLIKALNRGPVSDDCNEHV